MEKLGPEEASLESLIETELLKIQSLHPGGLELTEELAELCQISRGTEVLELACGTGESACFLAERHRRLRKSRAKGQKLWTDGASYSPGPAWRRFRPWTSRL